MTPSKKPTKEVNDSRAEEIEFDNQTIIRELHKRMKQSSIPLATGHKKANIERVK